MAHLSLDSPTSFRLVAAAAAAVGSLALVALGVEIGTDGLGLGDEGRNRAATASSRSAAVVDLSRARPVVALDDTLLSLVPAGPSPTAAVVGASPAPVTPAPTAAPAPAPEPAPAPPTEPAPVPAPELPAAPPVPGVPDPTPLLGPIAPVLEPVVDAVVEPLATQAAPPAATGASSTNAGLLTTLAGLLGL